MVHWSLEGYCLSTPKASVRRISFNPISINTGWASMNLGSVKIQLCSSSFSSQLSNLLLVFRTASESSNFPLCVVSTLLFEFPNTDWLSKLDFSLTTIVLAWREFVIFFLEDQYRAQNEGSGEKDAEIGIPWI